MLADDIAVALALHGPLTVADLAAEVGACESEVSLCLFASHGRFRAERNEGLWSLEGAGSGRVRGPRTATTPGGRAALAEVMALGSGLPAARPGFRPYPWQEEALAAWTRHGRRGVVEAVTGSGKTMVGVEAARQELERGGQVLVLVPTLELADQWASLFEHFFSARWRPGRLGAGSRADLAGHDVLVAVVNTARVIDVRPTRRGGLLVADECHRYGSAVNRLALDQRFSARLGLSATYAREDDGNLAWLDPYFGGTCFRLGYVRAVKEGVVAPFSVRLAGCRLAPDERERYNELSELLRALFAQLVGEHGLPREPYEEFLREVLALTGRAGSVLAAEAAEVARSYRQALLERRRLLAETPAKDLLLGRLAPEVVSAGRTLVFTQSVAAAERGSRVLSSAGVAAEALHSMLTPARRRDALRRFAEGDLVALVAPHVLDEGVDVPEADLAVVVAASRSRRQMVQRLGRVLRRKPDGRSARLVVLFVEGTVEDPRFGAHEGFLEEVAGVAESVEIVAATVDNPTRLGP